MNISDQIAPPPSPAVLAFAAECRYEREHSHQVTRIALALFDELAPTHQLAGEPRTLLQHAALLHDIGWLEGQKRHHKTAMRLILNASALPFDEPTRALVALIARYHRKATPRAEHPGYASLDPTARRWVDVLGGTLRLADGLDRSHQSLLRSVRCRVTPEQILLECGVTAPADAELWAARKKRDLLEMPWAETS